MKSLILTDMSTATAVAAGGVLPLGSAVHGYGICIKQNGNAINLANEGYYRVQLSLTAAVTGTSAVTVNMLSNGVEVPGATASAAPAAAGAVINIDVPWIIRKSCCCESTSLTFEVDNAITAQSVIVVVEKV